MKLTFKLQAVRVPCSRCSIMAGIPVVRNEEQRCPSRLWVQCECCLPGLVARRGWSPACYRPQCCRQTSVKISYTAAAVCKMYKDLTRRYNIVTMAKLLLWVCLLSLNQDKLFFFFFFFSRWISFISHPSVHFVQIITLEIINWDSYYIKVWG